MQDSHTPASADYTSGVPSRLEFVSAAQASLSERLVRPHRRPPRDIRRPPT